MDGSRVDSDHQGADPRGRAAVASPSTATRARASTRSPTRSASAGRACCTTSRRRRRSTARCVLDSFADWVASRRRRRSSGPREGWPQVERVLRAAFTFFEEHPDFVRLVRWEALEGGPFLREELAVLLQAAVRPRRRVPRTRDGCRPPAPLRRPAAAAHRVRRGALVPLRRAADDRPARHRPAVARRARGAPRARARRAAHRRADRRQPVLTS